MGTCIPVRAPGLRRYSRWTIQWQKGLWECLSKSNSSWMCWNVGNYISELGLATVLVTQRSVEKEGHGTPVVPFHKTFLYWQKAISPKTISFLFFLSTSEKCTYLKPWDLHFYIKSVLKNTHQNYITHNMVANKKYCHHTVLFSLSKYCLRQCSDFLHVFYYTIHQTLFSCDYGNNWTLYLYVLVACSIIFF